MTMEMPSAMAILKGLCLSQVAQSGELGPYHNTGLSLYPYLAPIIPIILGRYGG
jgi:hypothetical protein